METAKKSAGKRNTVKKANHKRSPAKKTTAKRSTAKKHATKKAAGKNKLGVKNSLVNNINAHKKRGDSKSRKKTTVSRQAYENMEQNWGRE